jgi:hypothetical protein
MILSNVLLLSATAQKIPISAHQQTALQFLTIGVVLEFQTVAFCEIAIVGEAPFETAQNNPILGDQQTPLHVRTGIVTVTAVQLIPSNEYIALPKDEETAKNIPFSGDQQTLDNGNGPAIAWRDHVTPSGDVITL